MINLLPQQEKDRLKFEQMKRLVNILEAIALISFGCLALVLLSVKFYILSDAISQKVVLEEAQKKYQTADFIKTRDEIKDYNNKFQTLKNFYNNEVYFSSVLSGLSTIERPDGVYLTNIYLSWKDSNTVEGNVSGFSSTRDNLLSYKTKLEENSNIKKVSFSQKSWVKSKDIDFYFTFEITKNGGN